MKWKKIKKELISLNYTIMLLPHSEKKPIHFKVPVWVLGLIFLALLIFSGTCLFFAGSRYQLAEVRREKEELEQEWMQLTLEKQAADEENENLRAAQEAQAEELKNLEQEARNMIQELEALVQREAEIRKELGLTQDNFDFSEESFDIDENTFDLYEGAFEPLAFLMEGMADFQFIQDELSLLQYRLAEKTGEYDAYLSVITARKEAEAEEKARKETLRTSIVDAALSYIGSPYVYGGSNPNTGTDCSGFTMYIFEQTTGIGLNRTAASQSTQGHPVSPDAIRPGDLVFYSSGGSIDHVAIYIGDGQIVHAANGRKGVIQSDLYYQTPIKFVNILGD